MLEGGTVYGRSARLSRGDYLRSARRRPRGDPGLFGFIGKAVGAVGGLVGSVLPGPAGAIVTKVSQAISGKPSAPANQMAAMSLPGGATPTAQLTTKRSYGGGLYKSETTTTSYEVKTTPSGQQVVVARPKRRRIDPTNVKALRRAIRREAGFIKLARRTGLVALPKAVRVRRAARKRR